MENKGGGGVTRVLLCEDLREKNKSRRTRQRGVLVDPMSVPRGPPASSRQEDFVLPGGHRQKG